MKGEDLEEMWVTRIVPHERYVWCAVGPLVIRVDPKVSYLAFSTFDLLHLIRQKIVQNCAHYTFGDFCCFGLCVT